MKKFILTVMITAAAASPAFATEKPGFYLGVDGTASFLQDDHIQVNSGSVGGYSYKTGYGAGANFGYDFGLIRTDVEYTFRNNETDEFNGFATPDSRIQSHAFMGNLYIDVPTDTFVKPYIGAGGGYALIHPQGDSSEGRPAYQGMAGLDFDINDNTTFYTGYKYFAIAGRAKFDEGFNTHYSLDYKSSNAEAGFRFKF